MFLPTPIGTGGCSTFAVEWVLVSLSSQNLSTTNDNLPNFATEQYCPIFTFPQRTHKLSSVGADYFGCHSFFERNKRETSFSSHYEELTSLEPDAVSHGGSRTASNARCCPTKRSHVQQLTLPLFVANLTGLFVPTKQMVEINFLPQTQII